MADFKIAHKLVLRWEGNYSNDPDDPGGETVYGISRAAHPDWEGWEVWESGDKAAVKELAERLYRKSYWTPLQCEQFPNQRLANAVYQAAVNCGMGTAAKWLQSSLNAYGAAIKVDGRVGNHTLHAIYEAERSSNVMAVTEAFLNKQRNHYYELAEKGQGKFLKGWLNRVASV